MTDQLPIVYYDYKALVLHRRSVCFVPCDALAAHIVTDRPEPR